MRMGRVCEFQHMCRIMRARGSFGVRERAMVLFSLTGAYSII